MSEETGCHGSKNADPRFFKNVGYGIQFDAPENNMISEYLMSKNMFDRDSEFFRVGGGLITEHFPSDTKYHKHPYTDIYMVNTLFNIPCLIYQLDIIVITHQMNMLLLTILTMGSKLVS